MPFYEFLWTPDNLEHATDHGVSVEEIERVIKYPERTGTYRHEPIVGEAYGLWF